MTSVFTIKVFFRAEWCPWCNAYLRDFGSHLDKVEALGGKIIAITSQAWPPKTAKIFKRNET